MFLNRVKITFRDVPVKGLLSGRSCLVSMWQEIQYEKKFVLEF